MNKKAFLMSLPLLASLLISACNRHTHLYGETYEYDNNGHWHVCECGEKSEVSPHKWDEGKIQTAATCLEDGTKVYTCECGATKTETITAPGHKPSEIWQNDETHHWHSCLNSTCFDELDKAEHSFEEDVSKRKDATCTTKGKKTLVCTVCDYSKTEDIELAEHQWDEGKVTTKPTCTENGEMTYTCKECERTRTETITAPGHNWVSKSSTTAYQYGYIGTWEECSACHTTRNHVTTTKAPWAAFDLDDENKVVCNHPDSETAYDKETHTLTTSKYQRDDGLTLTIGDLIDSTRKIIEVTLTINGDTAWGSQGTVFMLDSNGEKITAVFCLGKNPYHDFQGETACKITALEGGSSVTELSTQGAEFTYRFDFRGYTNLPRFVAINGANGQEATPDIISIKSVIVKESLCGHPATESVQSNDVASTCSVAGYTEYSCNHEGCTADTHRIDKEKIDHTPETVTSPYEEPEGYNWSGSRIVCSECGEILDNSNEVPAPWVRVPLSTATKYDSADGQLSAEQKITTLDYDETNNLVSVTGYYNGGVEFNVSNYSNNRNIVEVTFKSGTWRWTGPCFQIFYIDNTGSEIKSFHVYNDNGINAFREAGGVVLNEDGSTNNGSIDTENFYTYQFDVTSMLEKGKSLAKVRVGLYMTLEASADAPATTHVIKDVTLKANLCDHTKTETISTGNQYGTKCSTCGKMIEAYVNGTSVSRPSGKTDDDFKVEENVTYDGRDNCSKITTSIYTQNAAAEWAVNYKYKFTNLVKNARAAGKTIIKLHVYNQCSSTIDTSLGWGVGNNGSAAFADHYNNPTLMTGTVVVRDNTTITDENGDAAKLQANAWRVIVIDVSDDAFASWDDLWLTSSYNTSQIVPIVTYVSNIECVALAV